MLGPYARNFHDEVKQLREIHIFILHRIVQTNCPRYLSKRFLFISDVTSHSTRQGANLLYIPVHWTILYNRYFIVTACHLWNGLPDDIIIIAGVPGYTCFGDNGNEHAVAGSVRAGTCARLGQDCGRIE